MNFFAKSWKIGSFFLLLILGLGSYFVAIILSNRTKEVECIYFSQKNNSCTYMIKKISVVSMRDEILDEFYRLSYKNGGKENIVMSRFDGRPISLRVYPTSVVMIREVDDGYHKDTFAIYSKEQTAIEFIPDKLLLPPH